MMLVWDSDDPPDLPVAQEEPFGLPCDSCERRSWGAWKGSLFRECSRRQILVMFILLLYIYINIIIHKHIYIYIYLFICTYICDMNQSVCLIPNLDPPKVYMTAILAPYSLYSLNIVSVSIQDGSTRLCYITGLQ